MKYKQSIFFILGAIIFLTFFSGIIRHDVDEKAYLELAAEKQFDCVGRVFKDTTASGSWIFRFDLYQ